MSTCLIYPTVTVGNNTEDSILFKELVSYLGNREDAKESYYTAIHKSIANRYSENEFNKQGEPTLPAVIEHIKLDKYYPNAIGKHKRDAGELNSKGELIEYYSYREAFDKIEKYNNSEDGKLYPARIIKGENGYNIKIAPASVENTVRHEIANNRLNLSLRKYMNTLGYDVAIDNDLAFDGIFDPTNARENANGLIDIIRIAKGQKGQDALPEEFAHFMIEGMIDSPLVTRLLNSLDNDAVIKEILGEEYEEYLRLYDNREDLIKEVAGKLLAEYIISSNSNGSNFPLLERLWNINKNRLNKGNEYDIIKLINTYTRELGEAVNEAIKKNDTSIFGGSISSNVKALYKISREINSTADFMKEIILTIERQASEMSKIISKTHLDGSKNEAFSNSYKDKKSKALGLATNLKNNEDNPNNIDIVKGIHTALDTMSQDLEHSQKGLEDAISNFLTYRNFNLPLNEHIKNMNIIMKKLKSVENSANNYIFILNAIELEGPDSNGYYTLYGVKISKDIGDNIIRSRDTLRGKFEHMGSDLARVKMDIAVEYISMFYPDKLVGDKDKKTLVRAMLTETDSDINNWEKVLSTLANSSDLASSTLAKAFAHHRHSRNKKLEELNAKLLAAHNALKMSGTESTSFMYELNEDGISTGRFISEYDYDAYTKARIEFRKSLDEKFSGYDEISKRENIKAVMFEWDNNNTKEISFVHDNVTYKYKVPSDIYKFKNNPLDRLTEAQRHYYDTIIKLKFISSVGLPNQGFGSIHRIVFRRTDNQEILLDNNTAGIKEKGAMLWDDLKGKFIIREDDTSRGNPDNIDEFEDADDAYYANQRLDAELTENIMIDSLGERIKTVPVFYTKKLKDMRMISKDTTSSMQAYLAMATNYTEMNNAVFVLEAVRDTLKKRNIKQFSGDRKLVHTARGVMGKYVSDYVKEGGLAAERIDAYFDANLYGETTKDEGTFKILGKHVDIARTLDSVKELSSMASLAVNPLSSMSNVIGGKIQLTIEAAGGQFFGFKDLGKADAFYAKNVGAVLAELNSTNKSNIMSLLIDFMDPTGNFFQDMGTSRIRTGVVKRTIGNTSLLFMQNIGEFYLSVNVMGAMMNHVKLRTKEGTEITLLEAFDKVEEKYNGEVVHTRLKLKEGLVDMKGQPFTEERLNREKNRIRQIQHRLAGAFNTEDKGLIHQYAFGRMVMQFRQWMVNYVEHRYAKKSYNAELDEETEGYYRTLYNVSFKLIQALRSEAGLSAFSSNLTDLEKANLRKAGMESLIVVTIFLLGKMLGSVKDNKDHWAKRLSLYLLYRSRMEALALMPTPAIFDNMLSLVKSPMASIGTVDKLFNIIRLDTLFEKVESGKYMGENVYFHNLTKETPIIQNLIDFFDIDEDDSKFKLFNY